MKPQAVALCRMSTDQQDTSIADQTAEIVRTFGDRYEITRWYIDEGKSGSKHLNKRTEFLRLINDIKTDPNQPKVILCRDLARFNRLDSLDGAAVKNVLRENGVTLHTVQNGVFDYAETMSRMIDGMMCEQNNAFSVTIGKNGLNGRIKAAKDNQFTGGRVPYGYVRQVTNDRLETSIIPRRQKFSTPKTWRVTLVLGEPLEQEIVQWIFKRYHRNDVSCRQIATELNKQDIPGPLGSTWKYDNIQEILSNAVYIGTNKIGEDSNGAFARTTPDGMTGDKSKAEPLLIPDVFPAIIDKTTFAEVQQQTAQRTQSHSKPRKGGFPLTGVLFCGQCKTKMKANSVWGAANKDGKRTEYVRYVCSAFANDPQGKGKNCQCWSINQRTILPFILRRLVDTLDRVALEQMTTEPQPEPVKRDELVNQRDALKKKLERNRLNLLDCEDESEKPFLLEAIQKRKLELAELERKITDQENGKAALDKKALAAWWTKERHNLISIPTGELSAVESVPGRLELLETTVNVSVELLRSTLLRLGFKVVLFFKASEGAQGRRGRYLWDLDMGRATVTLPFAVPGIDAETTLPLSSYAEDDMCPLTGLGSQTPHKTHEVCFSFAGQDLRLAI